MEKRTSQSFSITVPSIHHVGTYFYPQLDNSTRIIILLCIIPSYYEEIPLATQPFCLKPSNTKDLKSPYSCDPMKCHAHLEETGVRKGLVCATFVGLKSRSSSPKLGERIHSPMIKDGPVKMLQAKVYAIVLL